MITTLARSCTLEVRIIEAPCAGPQDGRERPCDMKDELLLQAPFPPKVALWMRFKYRSFHPSFPKPLQGE